MAEPLRWLNLNLEFGGIDTAPAAPLLSRFGSVDLSRMQQLPEIVTLPGHTPDIIFLQEGKMYDRNGSELLHYTERLLHEVGPYRGLLTRSYHNNLHQVVYIDTRRLQVVHHWTGADPDEGGRRYGFVEVLVSDLGVTVMLKSIHLDPRDGESRLAQVKFFESAVKDGPAIIAGDFNSTTSRRSAERGEPQRDFSKMAPHQRYGKGIWPPTGDKGQTDADTRALDYLIDIGWVDQHIWDDCRTPTIRPGVDRGGELIIDRCLTFGPVTGVPGSVGVDEGGDPYSDHRAMWGAVMFL